MSIATVINSAGKKHALAVHIEREYNIFKVYIIDPLSCDKSEFKQEISDLQNILSILPSGGKKNCEEADRLHFGPINSTIATTGVGKSRIVFIPNSRCTFG